MKEMAALRGPQRFDWSRPFACAGGVLPELTIAYETWGEPNAARDNTVLVHPGLSASAHACSSARDPRPGWWEAFIGPGCALDTRRFHVVCADVLGGCHGTTGPASIDPVSGQPYAMDFPMFTVFDMARAQLLLLDALGVERVHASIGASLGGMQSCALAALAPARVERLISISAAVRSEPQTIASRYVQRRAIMSDPNWQGGRYYGSHPPLRGQEVARALATILYRSGPEWEQRFGLAHAGDAHPLHGEFFEVERYLARKARTHALDPNSYLYISRAMDVFNLCESTFAGDAGLASITCPTLIIGVSSDGLFPVRQQRELSELLARARADVRYVELELDHGHDSFLIDVEAFAPHIALHLALELG